MRRTRPGAGIIEVMTKRIKAPEVAAVFRAVPPRARRQLLALRKLILDTARSTGGVGEIEETLPVNPLSFCIASALTYHRNKKLQGR